MAATEKKDDPENAKGDKGKERQEKEEQAENHTPGQQTESQRGGHRKRTGGNPDGENG